MVTPLLPEHKISKITKITLKRNKTSFDWVSYSGNNNIPTNTQKGIEEYEKNRGTLKYFLMIDRDIEAGRFLIDKMCKTLDESKQNEAYCYASFAFKGYINLSFKAETFNKKRIMSSNYISSNSMIKTSCLKEIGGLITDKKYERLLDWCLWLKFLQYGYIGVPCKEASFIAHSEKDDVSSRSQEDYRSKHLKVYRDFIKPILV